MKKFFAFVCMIACVLGLTACGSEEKLTDYEQQKADYAKQMAVQKVIPLLETFMDDANVNSFDGYTAEEVKYMLGNDYQLNVDGYAFLAAIDSFYTNAAKVGDFTDVGEAEAKIDGEQIIVHVDIKGGQKAAQAEIIFSNDMFMVMEAASLHPVSTMGDMMGKAALNTLVGMGTVFTVLILIYLIISCFRFLGGSGKKEPEKEAVKSVAPAAAPVQPAAKAAAPVSAAAEETDDGELIAVIAAAIAASEGAVSADGFVVRSIRRVRTCAR